jgi:competence protein ComEA
VIWLTRRERTALAWLGLLGLAGLGGLLWQRRAPPLVVIGVPQPTEAAAWEAALEGARRVDVNAAEAAELERLPGVGPALAARIVAHRQAHGRFQSPEELMEVPGIGPKIYEAVAASVTTE